MRPRLLASEAEPLGKQAYAEIRERILSGKFQPGQRLSLRSVAQSMGMSMAPIGEAFRELARDGLLETESGWGSRVRRLDLEALRGQHILRTAIECEVMRQNAAHILPSHLEDLDRIARELDQLVAQEADPEAIFELDSRFHLRLAQATGITQLVETLSANQLIRLLARGARIAHGHRGLQQQHQGLVDALRSGDADIAERTMREHCVHSMTVQLEFFAAVQAGASIADHQS